MKRKTEDGRGGRKEQEQEEGGMQVISDAESGNLSRRERGFSSSF